jgi:hypothetical protein
MDRRDRELLARVSRVNTRLGRAVLELIHEQRDGEIPPEGLRALADVLRKLTLDLDARADEIDRPVIEAPPQSTGFLP